MSTPHIEANIDKIAKIVIMPGDPKRGEYIAKNYLDNYELVNTVRGMFAYTGYYKNKRITIFPSGMGCPSMGIYSYELFKEYDVDYIIRIGTCGAYVNHLNLKDVILVENSCSKSTYAKIASESANDIFPSSNKLNSIIKKNANENNIELITGNIYCTDVFYEECSEDFVDISSYYNALGVEMETFALFHNAKVLNKDATAILTVSDSFLKDDKLSALDREKSLDTMIKLALDTTLTL